MRLQDKRSFKGINFDDADEFLADGDTRNMLNVRVGYSENGDDGIITNVKGTISKFAEIGFNLPSGNNKCVGTCTDDQNNRLIWFNWNQYAHHGIYCYNSDTNTIQTILASATLNFDGRIIHSIDILNNILAWVDQNRPRSIDVTLALSGTYAGAPIEELINDAKIVPMFPPVCTAQITTSSNYIQALRSFQFIYRYVFVGGEKGAFSTVSRLVPTAYQGEHIAKITLDVSTCELFTSPSILPIISFVEFASRELYTLNFNQFLRITATDLLVAGGVVEYLDTESKTTIDTAESDISFYENPIKAGTVAFQNDRKFYADCTEGYDAFGLSTSNVNTEIIPQEGGIPYLSDCDTHGNERYLKPDSVYSYSAEWHDGYGRKSGAIDLPELVIKTQPQIGNDYKANVLNFDLNLTSTYAPYAKKIEVLRSDNQSVTFFVQGRANNVLYCTGYDTSNLPVYLKPGATPAGVGNLNNSDAGAIEIHVDISNWAKYKTNIGYTWTENDRVSFFTMGGTGTTDVAAPPDLRNLRIKELRGSLLIVDYNPIGRTNLNDMAMAQTSYTSAGLTSYQNARFVVGNTGVLLYSVKTQLLSTPGTAFDNLTKSHLVTTNNLNSLSLIYGTGLGNISIGLYVVGGNGYFVKNTFNSQTGSFETFTEINTGVTDNLNCIESDYSTHNMADLIIVGDSGRIIKYNVAGNTISNQTSGVSTRLNYVFRESSVLIAVGDEGVILRSTNNGTTWTQVASGVVCQNLNSVYLLGSNGCIVGDEGVALLTSDAGVTWARLDISTKNNLYSVDGEGSSTNKVYIGGEGGYIGYVDISTQMFIGTPFNNPSAKTINRLFSFSTTLSGGTNDQGALIGDVDLLYDIYFPSDTFTAYSSYVQALYGSIYLNYKAKIEVFSPKTTGGPTIYFEVGDAYAVGQNYSFSKGKGNDGDVYLIKKDFRGFAVDDWSSLGDFIFSMTPDSNNTAGAWDKDLGRPNTVLLYPELQQRRNIIRHSDKYVQDSKINGLSNFQETNYELIPNEFGWVRKITPIETMLLINAERESATAHIDQTMFTQTNGQQVAAISNKVINNVRRLAGGFGCANPESIVHYLGNIYWYSSNKSAVCRYNNYNGVFPISEYKARTHFYGMVNYPYIIGGFDPKFKNYLITCQPELQVNGDFSSFSGGWYNSIGMLLTGVLGPQSNRYGNNGLYSGNILTIGETYIITVNTTRAPFSVQTLIYNGLTYIGNADSLGIHTIEFVATDTYYTVNVSDGEINNVSLKQLVSEETIAFQDQSNRWISKYSFVPEMYGVAKIDMFSFKNGELWKHDASNGYNNFYGHRYTSKVNPVFNRELNSQKSFNSISLESQKVWSAISIRTPEGQLSVLSDSHFEQINKEWWADIKQDMNTPNLSGSEALFNGDFMQSNVLNVVLESTLSDFTKLRFVNLYSNINERTNK